MLRLARVREEDPALLRDGAKKFQARGAPALDEEFCRLSPEALAESLPNYEDRRVLLARDPLACAEGFRTGGRAFRVVACAEGFRTGGRAFRVVARSCGRPLAQDARAPDAAPPVGGQVLPALPQLRRFGAAVQRRVRSNALATGGVLGRVDAVFGSIECQKSGTLHAHLQVFVQCRHQRGSLGKPQLQTLLQRYASYTAHVRRSVYCEPTCSPSGLRNLRGGRGKLASAGARGACPEVQTRLGPRTPEQARTKKRFKEGC